MKTKASHNSATGEHPRNLWAKLFGCVARCQNKTIVEQFDAGVRLFDVRVRYDKDGVLRCYHGLAEYKQTLASIVLVLSKRLCDDVWVMVTYEGLLEEENQLEFYDDVSRLFSGTEYVKLGHVSVKYPEWNIIAPNPKMPAYEAAYTKIVGWKVLIPFPRFWWWLDKVIEEDDSQGKPESTGELMKMEDFV